MSQTSPPAEKTTKAKAKQAAPPDEQFWQRYSPHAEFPLSSAGSLVMHILGFGLLLLAYFLAPLLFQPTRQLPVEAVVLSGGGGSPHGQGEGPQTESDKLVEASDAANDKKPPELLPDEVPPPKLDVKPETQSKQTFDQQPRKIQDEDASRAFNSLKEQTVRMKPSGIGKGGTGSGGGSGKGRGTGIGDANGPGMSTPSQREKRMLRWSMLFNTTNSSDYVAQLRGLRAILAIPVREDAASGVCDYRVLRDLSTSRPAKFTDEDIHNIQRLVSWNDDNPDSVAGVMSVLRLPQKPSHFLAFMPVELEEKLLRLELDYLHKHHNGRREENIKATRFKIRVYKGKYEPEVIGQDVN